MKTNILIALATLFMLWSCSEDDTNVFPENLSYATALYDVGFYESGQSGVAQITWNGETGTYGLADSYEGVSINSATGQISWNGDLPLGITEVNVVATNSAGNVSAEVTLDHKFSGSFTGSYNYDPGNMVVSGDNYNLTFLANGNMTVSDFTTEGTGTWTIDDNNNISATYDYGYGPLYLDAELTYSDSQNPFVDGLWGSNPNDINSGYFKTTLD